MPRARVNENRLIEQAERFADEVAAALGSASVGRARGEAITSMSNAYRTGPSTTADDTPPVSGHRPRGDTQGEAVDRAVADVLTGDHPQRRRYPGPAWLDRATGHDAERERTAALLHTHLAHPASDGTVTGTPRRWLRLEAVSLVAGSLVAYSTTNQPWWLIPIILLVPDLVMVGYLGGTRVGAITYNLAHSTPFPAALTFLGWWQHAPLVVAFGLVWLAHIGMDRAFGYGLKYDDHFEHTHLGRLG